MTENNSFKMIRSAFTSATIAVSFAALTTSFIVEKEKAVADFKLLNVNGKYYSLKDDKNAKGYIVVFTCNHCPFAKLYPKRLNKLNNQFSRLHVPLIAISSTDTLAYEADCYNKMRTVSLSEHYNFPYLYDASQSTAKDFGAQKTPHAYVIWKENEKWIIKYNGAIDDNGAEPDKVKQHYVADAVSELLQKKTVATKETISVGCQIKFRKS
jgi:peroxiredoxin